MRRPSEPGPSAEDGRWGRRIGPILAKVRLHTIERRVSPGGGRVVAKRRRRSSPALIVGGNLYLRWLGAGVVVLGDRRWKERERAVHRRIH